MGPAWEAASGAGFDGLSGEVEEREIAKAIAIALIKMMMSGATKRLGPPSEISTIPRSIIKPAERAASLFYYTESE